MTPTYLVSKWSKFKQVKTAVTNNVHDLMPQDQLRELAVILTDRVHTFDDMGDL